MNSSQSSIKMIIYITNMNLYTLTLLLLCYSFSSAHHSAQAQQVQQQQQQQQSQNQQQQQPLSLSNIAQIAGQIVPSITSSNSASTAALNSNRYVIKYLGHDQKTNVTLVSLEPVNFTNQQELRIELRYQSKYPFVSIDERAPNNTVVAAIIVNNDDGKVNNEDFTVSIEHGNELGHFKLVSTQHTNTIQVAASPLSKQLVPEYNLTIVARDHGSPPKSSSANLVIKLNTSASPMGTNAPLEPQPSLKLPVTDLMYFGSMLVVIFLALIFILIIGCALVQRPNGKKPPPPRTTSATNSRNYQNDFVCLQVR